MYTQRIQVVTITSDPLTVRLAERDAERLRRLVESGEFASQSDFLRYAVKTTLQDLAERRAQEETLLEPVAELEGPGALDAPGGVSTTESGRPDDQTNKQGRTNE